MSELVARAEDTPANSFVGPPTNRSGPTRPPATAAEPSPPSPTARSNSSKSSSHPAPTVSYPADAYIFKHQQIWILEGDLHFREGDVLHQLSTGDCLQLGAPAPCTFINPTKTTSRYLVALVKDR